MGKEQEESGLKENQRIILLEILRETNNPGLHNKAKEWFQLTKQWPSALAEELGITKWSELNDDVSKYNDKLELLIEEATTAKEKENIFTRKLHSVLRSVLEYFSK